MDMIIIQIFAICIGFGGHECPVVDGVIQHWNEDEIWTIYYFPHLEKWQEPKISDEWVNGSWSYDKQGAHGKLGITMVIGGNTSIDKWGYSPMTHELRHAQCRCNSHW